MTSGKHTFTPAGRQRRATYVEVCNWVIWAWDKVKSTTIVNGFRKCGIIPEPAADVSSSDDFSAESDKTDANKEQLAAALEVFCDASDFDSSFDIFKYIFFSIHCIMYFSCIQQFVVFVFEYT